MTPWDENGLVFSTVYHLLMATSNRIMHQVTKLKSLNMTVSSLWPPQSPDLNPIGHLWDVVEQEIHGCVADKSAAFV